MKLSLLIFISIFFIKPLTAQNYDRLRENMVRYQISGRGILNPATLEAMRKVERHLFVPSEFIHRAYEDGPLPIGYGQTISQPYIVAYMTQVIDPKPHYKVLEIGAGSGYQAAILAEIVEKVYSMEIIPELCAIASKRLKDLNYNNIELINADGYYGLEEHAPYDAIVVTAAAEHVPPALIQQLKDGGKMIIPVGSPFLVQTLMLIEKKKGKISSSSLMPVRFVPFTRN